MFFVVGNKTMADQSKENEPSVAVAQPKRKTLPGTRPKPRHMPLFNVVLLDDDDHTYDYVIEMLGVVFAYGVEKALQMAKEVDKTGRVIVLTTHRELAELKCEQILAHGADPRMSRSKGSMRAIVEAVEE